MTQRHFIALATALTHSRPALDAPAFQQWRHDVDAVAAVVVKETATTKGAEMNRHMDPNYNNLLAAAAQALKGLEDMTSEQFAHGADRELRFQLVNALWLAGQVDDDKAREYGVL